MKLRYVEANLSYRVAICRKDLSLRKYFPPSAFLWIATSHTGVQTLPLFWMGWKARRPFHRYSQFAGPFFLAPALCWWAWTMDASIEISVNSAPLLSFSRYPSKFPVLYICGTGCRRSSKGRSIPGDHARVRRFCNPDHGVNHTAVAFPWPPRFICSHRWEQGEIRSHSWFVNSYRFDITNITFFFRIP